MQYKGLTALVTGASSGLGEEFARQLATLGSNLVLVARSKEKLEALAGILRERGNIRVSVMPGDLSSDDAVAKLIADVRERDIHVDILINNAGIGLFENFLDAPLNHQMEEIDLNVRAVVSLTHAFAPGMVAVRHGGIINIASTAAFQPGPGAGIYAASKAFVLFFSEALSFELQKSGVRVIAACPGPVATNFFATMNPTLSADQMDKPATVVREILTAFEKKQRIVVPGKLKNRLGTLGARFLPRNTMLRLAAGIMQQLDRH